MSPEKLNRHLHAELMHLVARGELTFEEMERIGERYPVTRWDVVSLIRWFTLLGAVSVALGVVVLVAEGIDAEVLAQGGPLLLGAALLVVARRLLRPRDLPRAAAALELLGGVSLTGAVWAIAVVHSSGSGNWPAVVGACTVLTTLLAYVLQNPLLLIYACGQAFVWFGGSTGYLSGWGAYWLGMTYPARFIAAGAVSLGIGAAHLRWATAWPSFARVWLHFGALVIHLALWFLSLFGWFEERITWNGNHDERVAFSLVWAIVAGASLAAGGRFGLALLRGYGMTFLVVNAYTFYFQFIAANSDSLWFLHLLLVGGSLLALGVGVERLRKRQRAPR